MYVLKLRSNNLDDTEHIGAIIARPDAGRRYGCAQRAACCGQDGDQRGLFGARGFCAHVCSPSYTIINEYAAGGKTAYHMDVYRLSDESELDETGYEDCLQTGELNVIEWADRIAGRLPEGALFIEMSPGAEDANARILTVKTDDEILFTALREALDAYTCD